MFFFAAKHQPALAKLAPFGDDPYDAVGSFAVQVAVVAAALSGLRAVRSHGSAGIPEIRSSLILRGAVISALAIFIAVLADLVAMIRYPEVWLGRAAGLELGLFLIVLALAAFVGAGRLARGVPGAGANAATARGRAALIAAAGALLLGFYPRTWRHGFAGAVLTAVFGMALLFAWTWALAKVLVPGDTGDTDDLLDDLHAPKPVARWLRAHPWRCVVWSAVIGGLALALLEALGEGLPASARRALLVLGVFTGIEGLGIVLGFALFRRQLGLLRTE